MPVEETADKHKKAPPPPPIDIAIAPVATEHDAIPDEETDEEDVEISTAAARAAGLMAARELTDTPAYDRWSAGTLASDAPFNLDAPRDKTPRTPFVIASVCLLTLLLAQLVFHFRSQLVQTWPVSQNLFESLQIEVPPAREGDLMAIESSDLQIDTKTGGLVLQANLNNRARFAQAWPALELTLTDMNDQVIARRVMQPTDYLPEPHPPVFAPRSDYALKLWLESKGPAAGYRLYLFYP